MSSIGQARSTPLFAVSMAAVMSVWGCSSNDNNSGAGGSASLGGSGSTTGGASASTGGSTGMSTTATTENKETGGSATGGNASTGGTTAMMTLMTTARATGGTVGMGGTSGMSTTGTSVSGGSTSKSSTSKASGGTGGAQMTGSGGRSEANTGTGVGGGTANTATGGVTGMNTGTHTGGHSGGGSGPVGGTKAMGGMSAIGGTSGPTRTGTSSFQLTSAELSDGGTFPKDATCESSFSSSRMPSLAWTGAPPDTKSFAMVFVDVTLTGANPPSANGFHSAMWNIPKTVSSLPEGLPAGSPPAGIAGLETVVQKKAPSGNAWLGPCPNFPNTTHTKTDTYQFRLYALNVDTLPSNTSSMSVQQIYNYLEALPPLGVAILTGKSDAAATALK